MTIKRNSPAYLLLIGLLLPTLAACSTPLGFGATATPPVGLLSAGSIASLAAEHRLGSGSAEAAAWSPDGTILAIATSLQIDLYDAKTMQLNATLDSTDQWNGSLAFSPDGKLLAAGTQHGATQVWDVSAGRVLRNLANDGPQSGPRPILRFTPDGKQLFIAADQTIDLWDLDAGRLVDSFPGQTGGVADLAVSPDGKTLLVARGGSFYLRDLATRELLYQPVELGVRLAALFLDRDGSHFTTVSADETRIARWELRTGKRLDEYEATAEDIYDVDASADRRRIATLGLLGFSVWDSVTKDRLFSQNTGGGFGALALSPDGGSVLSIGETGVQLWDVEQKKLLRTFDEYNGRASAAAFSPDGRLVAVSGSNRRVQLRSLAEGKLLATFDGSYPLAFSPDGNLLAFGQGEKHELRMTEYSDNAAIGLLDTSTGKTLPDAIPCESATTSAFSPDGSLLAYGGERCELTVRDLRSGQTAHTLSDSDSFFLNDITSLAFSPDGRRLLVGGNRSVRIWDVEAGLLLKTIDGLDFDAHMALSPDGRFLALSGIKGQDANGDVQVWDLVSERHVFSLRSPQDQLDGLAFSRDGELLAVAGKDFSAGRSRVEFWNAWTGQPLTEVEISADGALALAFGPDGMTLLTAERNGAIRTWQARPAASVAARPATPTYAPTPTVTAPAPVITIDKLAQLGKGISQKANRSPDGRIIAQLEDDTLKWYDAKTFVQIGSVKSSKTLFGAVTLSPDGGLAVLDGNYGAEIIDLSSQSILGSVNGGNGSTGGYAFTRDGKHMAYLARDHTSGGSYYWIGLWDRSIPNAGYSENPGLPTLPQSGYYIMSNPAISPDGRLVAAGHSDKHVYIWELGTRKLRFALAGHAASVTGVDFSPDGRLLASGSADGTVRLWDPATGKFIRLLGNFADDILAVRFSADGQSLQVSLSGDLPAQSVDVRTGQAAEQPEASATPDPFEVRQYEQGYAAGFWFAPGRQVMFSPNGQALALANDNVLVWGVAGGNLLASLGNLELSPTNGMAFSPDGTEIAVITADGNVRVWDLQSGRQLLAAKSEFVGGGPIFFAADYFENNMDPVAGEGPAFSPDGTRLVFGNHNNIEVWDVLQARKLRALSNPARVFATRLSFSADGKHLYALINHNQAAQVWDVATGKLLRNVALSAENENANDAIDLNGPRFVRMNADDQGNQWLELWDLESGQSRNLDAIAAFGQLRFSPDGSLLAAAGTNQFYIWKTATGQLVYRSEEYIIENGLVASLAFSPDNRSLALAGAGKADLWDISRVAQRAQQANLPDLLPLPTATPPLISWPSATPQPTATPAATIPAVRGGALLPASASSVTELSRFGAGTVEQAVWSPAGDALLVAGSLGVARYDLRNATGDLAESLHREHAGWTSDVVVLADGRTLATGADRQTGRVQAWDVATGAGLADLPGGGEPAISPDGSLLVYLGEDDTLQVWDLVRRQALAALRSHSRAPRGPVFSPDGTRVAAVEASGARRGYAESLRIWDARTGIIVNALGGPDNRITDFSYSADGRFIVAAAGGSAWIWPAQPGAAVDSIELYKGTISYNLHLYDHTVTSVGISPDDRIVAVGTSERVIWLYERQSHAVLLKLEGHAAALRRLRFSPDGKLLLAVDDDGALQVWDAASGKALAGSTSHTGAIGGLLFRQDGELLAWQAGSAWTLHPADGSLLHTTRVHGGSILAASPAGDWLAVYDPYRISLWDAASGAFKQTLEGEAQEATNDYHFEGLIFRGFSGAAFSPDGSRLATAGTGGIWLYDIKNDGRLLQQFPGMDARKLAFSPDGSRLLTSLSALMNPPGILDLQTGNSLFSLVDDQAYYQQERTYAFSPDGRWAGVLAQRADGTYHFGLWDATAQKLVKSIDLGKGPVTLSLAFDAAGALLALGREDGGIMLLSLPDLAIITTLSGHIGAVDHLSFSPDGLYLASSSQDGTVRIWGLP